MKCEILQGDCLETLQKLKNESIHACVTSPPYYGKRDYGCKGQIGLEPSLGEYIQRLVAVFAEVKRVLRNDGVLWLNLGDGYARSPQKGDNRGWGKHAYITNHLPDKRNTTIPLGLKEKDLMLVPARVAIALQEDGWWLRSKVTWCKERPNPESMEDRPTCATEEVFLLTKQPTYFYDNDAIAEPSVSNHGSGNGFKRAARLSYADGNGPRGNDQPWEPSATRNRRNWWVIDTANLREEHYAAQPEELARLCILSGTSEKGACWGCGAPWKRIIRKEKRLEGNSARAGRSPEEINGSGKWTTSLNGNKSLKSGPVIVRKTIGWEPTCRCGIEDTVPCTVLDPFAGSGTTGRVALSLGRQAVLCELSPKYCEMIERRLKRVQIPLDLAI